MNRLPDPGFALSGSAVLTEEVHMRPYQKLLPLAAILTVTALAGCASRQPSTSVVVVPPTQTTTVAQAAPSIRTGTVIAIIDMSATNRAGAGSSGGTVASGAASAGQVVTVQFDDGQRQTFDLAAGGQLFNVGERVTVNTTQSPAVIAR